MNTEEVQPKSYNFEASVANALQPVRNFEPKTEMRSIL